MQFMGCVTERLAACPPVFILFSLLVRLKFRLAHCHFMTDWSYFSFSSSCWQMWCWQTSETLCVQIEESNGRLTEEEVQFTVFYNLLR